MAGERSPAFSGAEVPIYDISAFEEVAALAWKSAETPITDVQRDCYDSDSCPQSWTCASAPPNCDSTSVEAGCTVQGCATDPDMTCPKPDDPPEE
ncbi:MAG TPA: hypothetical protein VFT53_02570 [Candidatus Saccharimonadales bacterium]|nr:hypothetical protein [Candidatus Saccharimonadales bacterium]